MEKLRQRLVNCVEGHNICGTIRKRMCCSHGSLVTSPTTSESHQHRSSGRSLEASPRSWARLRLHFTSLTPGVESAVLWQVFPSHTFSQDYISKTGKCGIVVRTDGGVGETGPRRRKTEEKTNWSQSKRRKNQGTSWEAARQEGKPQQKGVPLHLKGSNIQKCYWKGNS